MLTIYKGIKLFFLLMCSCFFLLLFNSCSKSEKAPSLEQPLIWITQSPNSPITFENKVTCLIFLTSNCGSCTEVSTVIKKLTTEYKNKIQIIGIFTPMIADTITEVDAKKYVIQKLNISYPVLFDEKSHNRDKYQIDVWPTLILINKSGEIQKRIYGTITNKYMDDEIQKLLQGENK